MPNLNPDTVREILTTYDKYGWVLRRVLLTESSRATLNGVLRADVHIAGSDIDAAWFSRPKDNGPIAWEIRYLGETQYALLEYLDESEPDFEERLHDVETRLRGAIIKRSDA
jgi:hypothetical protein